MSKFADSTYKDFSYELSELEHLYGDNYHILADPFLLSELAKLCKPECKQPMINEIIQDLYRQLVANVMANEFPRSLHEIKTRMAESAHERGIWTGEVLDEDTKTVTVNIARGGTLPSQICFEYLNKVLNPDFVRQDHVIMARTTDKEGHVTGAHFGESKIGGDVDGAIVLFPDPMGATGASISEAVSHYKDDLAGDAKKYIAINLIVTPEYLRRLKTDHPDLIVYALRLDRGSSSEEILASKPGTHWDEESGLNDIQYILPGGGGFGELMNNSYC